MITVDSHPFPHVECSLSRAAVVIVKAQISRTHWRMCTSWQISRAATRSARTLSRPQKGTVLTLGYKVMLHIQGEMQTTSCKTSPPCETEGVGGGNIVHYYIAKMPAPICWQRWKGIVCLVHTLQLVMKDALELGNIGTREHYLPGMLPLLEIRSLVEACCWLVTHFSCSIKSVHLLNERWSRRVWHRISSDYDHPAKGRGDQNQLQSNGWPSSKMVCPQVLPGYHWHTAHLYSQCGMSYPSDLKADMGASLCTGAGYFL